MGIVFHSSFIIRTFSSICFEWQALKRVYICATLPFSLVLAHGLDCGHPYPVIVPSSRCSPFPHSHSHHFGQFIRIRVAAAAARSPCLDCNKSERSQTWCFLFGYEPPPANSTAGEAPLELILPQIHQHLARRTPRNQASGSKIITNIYRRILTRRRRHWHEVNCCLLPLQKPVQAGRYCSSWR